MPATWEGLSKSLREILFLGLVGQIQVADKENLILQVSAVTCNHLYLLIKTVWHIKSQTFCLIPVFSPAWLKELEEDKNFDF